MRQHTGGLCGTMYILRFREEGFDQEPDFPGNCAAVFIGQGAR